METFQNLKNLILPNLYKGKFAELYDLFYEKHWDYNQIASLFEKHLKKHKIKKILEVGGGSGRLSKILEKKGFSITALDSSKKLVKVFRKMNPSIKIICGDIRNIDIKDKFDAVILAGRTFTHFTKEEDIKKTLNSFNKALKNRGILIFDNFKADKMSKKEIFKPKEVIRNGGLKLTRTSKLKIVSKRPTIVRWFYSFKIDGKNSKVYSSCDIIRGFTKKELEGFLKQAHFEVLEFAVGFDNNSFIAVARKLEEVGKS